jgi:hypothetical protein
MSLHVGWVFKQRLTFSASASVGRGIAGEPLGTCALSLSTLVDVSGPSFVRCPFRLSLSVPIIFVCERRTVGLASFG